MSKFTLNRRTMLRGMVSGSAVGIGLPLLEAMLNTHGEALADGSDLPLRFIAYYWADGIVIDQWEPPDTGAGYTLSPALQPLQGPIKDYVNVISGMGNLYNGQFLTHHEGMCGFSGHPIIASGGLNSDAGGATLDQVIADLPGVADCTPVRATHVRISKRESQDGDGGTTVVAMSHRDAGGGNIVAQIPETNPVEVWQNLFGTFMPSVDDADRRLSVLDFVKADADALKDRLGMADRARIDAHLRGISELETKITAVIPSCELPDTPTETNQDVGGVEQISSVVAAMSGLIAQAFVCDITRVATVLFKKFVADSVFDEINANDQHHSASHGGPNNATYRAGITYQMEKFADLLNVLHGTEDPMGGNLLDNTIVFATSDCSTGQVHSIERQPMLVAGRGGGHLVAQSVHHQSTPWNNSHSNPNSSGNMSDVLLSCLRAFDPGANSVGSGAQRSEDPLTDILA
ncbi:MAG: DUF1552 domain-containing protein [Nannocystaceae bacterium]|nr:DUF1552 domain-containing protein [Nannocystaceae bacterium]